MSKDRIIKKLKDYFSGRKSNEGRRYFDTWFDSFDDSEVNLTKEEEDNIEKALADKLIKHIENDNQRYLHDLPTGGINWKRYVVAASSLLLVALMLNLLFFRSGKRMRTEEKVAMLNLEVPPGKRMMITLTDGTRIRMNSASKLYYPEVFTGNKREVVLEGEAFFEVARDAKKPFIIHTGVIETKVLGTSFNINYNDGNRDIEVAVLTGKVEVSNPTEKKHVVLIPNQVAIYNKTNKALIKDSLESVHSKIAWIEGILIFDDSKLGDIVKVLNRKYGVSIVLNCNKLEERRITTSFKDESLERVLQIIAKQLGFTYKRIGDRFLIEDKGCN